MTYPEIGSLIRIKLNRDPEWEEEIKTKYGLILHEEEHHEIIAESRNYQYEEALMLKTLAASFPVSKALINNGFLDYGEVHSWEYIIREDLPLFIGWPCVTEFLAKELLTNPS